jgi:hypothetical protein
MTSIKGKRQLWQIAGAALLVSLFGIIAMFAVSQSNKRSCETETLLYQLEASAQELNANQWEAIATLRIDSELDESSVHFRGEILNDVRLIHPLQNREGLTDEVHSAVATYLSTMDEEFALVSKGQVDKAQELDHSRVDLVFWFYIIKQSMRPSRHLKLRLGIATR